MHICTLNCPKVLSCLRSLVVIKLNENRSPVKKRGLVDQQMKVIFGAHFSVTMVNCTLETSCSFSTHL